MMEVVIATLVMCSIFGLIMLPGLLQKRQQYEEMDTIEVEPSCRVCDASPVRYLESGEYVCQDCGFRSEWESHPDLREPLERLRAAQQARSTIEETIERRNKAKANRRGPNVDLSSIMQSLTRATKLLDEAGVDPATLPEPGPSHLEAYRRRARDACETCREEVFERAPDRMPR